MTSADLPTALSALGAIVFTSAHAIEDCWVVMEAAGVAIKPEELPLTLDPAEMPGAMPMLIGMGAVRRAVESFVLPLHRGDDGHVTADMAEMIGPKGGIMAGAGGEIAVGAVDLMTRIANGERTIERSHGWHNAFELLQVIPTIPFQPINVVFGPGIGMVDLVNKEAGCED